CCREASTGAPWWVPEEMVYVYARDGRHRLAPAGSTGLTCGRVGDPVLVRGLQEVIERDTLVGAWWGRYPLEEWPADAVWRGLGPDITERVVRPNLRYRFYRVATPHSIHVTLVTAEGEDRDGFRFTAGSACRETRRQSWEKALLEAVQGLHYVRFLKGESGPPAGQGTAGWTTFPAHATTSASHQDRCPRPACTPRHPPLRP